MTKKEPEGDTALEALGALSCLVVVVVAGNLAADSLRSFILRRRMAATLKELTEAQEVIASGVASQGASAKRLTVILEKLGRKTSKPLVLTNDEDTMAQEVLDPEDIESTFADIGGLDELKQEIWEVVVLPIRKPEFFSNVSKLKKQPTGVLLYGKPGCGKTLLAKAVAKESGAVFIPMELSRLLNSLWGESEKLIQATFTLARKVAPSIIFVDELDSVFSKIEKDSNRRYMDCIKKSFLTNWEGISTDRRGAPVLVFGATNHPQELDKAILRRLPRSFEVPLPDKAGREQILKLLLQDEPMDESAKAFLPTLAKDLTDGYSGSDLREVCCAAVTQPLREVFAEESRRAVRGEKPPDSQAQPMEGFQQEISDKDDSDKECVSKEDNKATPSQDDSHKLFEWFFGFLKTQASCGKDNESSDKDSSDKDRSEKADKAESSLKNADESTKKLRLVTENDFRIALDKVKRTGQAAEAYGNHESSVPEELRNTLYI